MDAQRPYHEVRQSRSWLYADVDVIELQGLELVSRDLASKRLSLRAALNERGGKMEARLRPRVPTQAAYRGPDHLSLIPASEEVWGWTDRIDHFRCVVVNFADDFIGELVEIDGGLSKRSAPHLMFENKMMWTMASRLAMECLHPQPGSRLYGDSLIGAMAVELLRAQSGHPMRMQGGIAPARLRHVMDYIDSALEQDISMQELAHQASLSVPHFARAFRQSTGQTPFRYVVMRRVERARRLLVSSTLPIVEIAAACGFADQAHMNKCFKRLVGDSPGRLRRAH